MTEPTNSFLPNVQFLRFVAALSVLTGHVQHEAGEHDFGAFTPFEPVFWGIGVDIFFIISGFIMYFMTAARFGERGMAAGFLRRRIIRVVPLYWLFTTLMLIAMLAVPHAIAHNDLDAARAITSYAFIPWPRADGALRPVLSLGWTLNYEIFFYLCFAIALCLPRRIAMPGLVALFVGLSAAHFLIPKDLRMLAFWSDPLILLFPIGIGLAHLHRVGVRIGGGAAAALAAGGTMLLVLIHGTGLEAAVPARVLWSAVPATMIAAAAILYPRPFVRGRLEAAALEGGNASYALYLSHPFAMNLVALVWGHLHLGHPVLYVLSAMAVAILGAVLTYRWVERPLLGWFAARRALARAPASA